MANTMTKYPSVETLFVESGYAGQCGQTVSQLHDIYVQVVRHPANKNVGRWTRPEQPDLFPIQADANGFVVLAKRWVVERSHAPNERACRLVMHHDRLILTRTQTNPPLLSTTGATDTKCGALPTDGLVGQILGLGLDYLVKEPRLDRLPPWRRASAGGDAGRGY